MVVLRTLFGVKETEKLECGGCVLPREALCPISCIGIPNVYTENTLTVHKYGGLLIDRKGTQAASAQRKRIGDLIHVAEIGDKI